MRVSESMKKAVSVLLALSLVLSYLPAPALAEEVCPHHEHSTESCGFVEGAACTHEHGEGCGDATVTKCVHVHGQDGCTYVPGTPAVFCHPTHTEECGYNAGSGCQCDLSEGNAHLEGCGYAEAAPCTVTHEGCGCAAEVPATGECNHGECTAETGCVTTGFVCAHTVHVDCGYVAAKPCTFDPAACVHCAEAAHTHVYDGTPVYAKKDASVHTVTRACTTCEEQPVETADEAHTYTEGLCVCGEAEPVKCTCESTDPGEHAPFCALYVRTNEECKCVVNCAEEGLNNWCETCYFEGAEACAGGEEEAVSFVQTGVTGECSWTFDENNGLLTISGPGSMGSNSFSAIAPSITSVIIEDGVTSISNNAFRGCTSLKSVSIPGSVTSIGDYAFAGCSSLISVYTNCTEEEWSEKVASSAFSRLTPTFVYEPSTEAATYTVTAAANPTEGGTVTGGGSYEEGKEVTLTATAAEGYTFVNWTENGAEVSKDAAYTFTAEKDRSLVAVFDSNIISGTTGGKLTWTLDKTTGHLTISGKGTMTAYTNQYGTPWGTDIRSVEIESGVTSIGRNAFLNCAFLKSVTIPSTVTDIDIYAFAGCARLTSVNIPDSVTTIGGYAFDGCTRLTSVTIPDSVTTIAAYTFYECNSLASVTIPDSVTSIGGYAFYECNSLASVTIPDSVKTIGGGAFSYCSGLTSVTIPDSVTSIGNGAFYDCTSLTNVTYLGTNPPEIGNEVFSGSGVSYVTVPWNYESDDFGGKQIVRMAKPVTYTVTVTPTEGGTVTGGGSYEEGKEVTLTATAAEGYTFVNWTENGAEVSKDAAYTFTAEKDRSLVAVFDSNIISGTTGGNLTWTLDKTTGHLTISGKGTMTAYTNQYGTPWGTDIRSVEIESGVTSIGRNAFLNCAFLKSVTIPSSVTKIEAYAFYNCSSLTTVKYLGESVPVVGANAFRNCGLDEVNVPAGYNSDRFGDLPVKFDTEATTYTVTFHLNGYGTAIPQQTVTKNGKVVKPENPTVEGQIFAGWYADEELTTEWNFETNTVTDDTDLYAKWTVTCEHDWNTYTGICGYCSETHGDHEYTWTDGACSVCGVVGGYCGYTGDETLVEYVLTSENEGGTYTITISGTGKMGEYNAVNQPWSSYCGSITTAVVNSGVQDVGWGAFKNHTALTSVSIPNSITKIGSMAFYGTTNLRSVTLPSALTSLGSNAFYNSGIQSITIPAGVTKIQYNTFQKSKLSSINLGNVTTIDTSAFQDCKQLTSITLPGTLATIGTAAFSGSNLTSVTIPSSVTKIGERAFQGCNALKTVSISGGDLNVMQQAFRSDDALETLTITNTGTVTLGKRAFALQSGEQDKLNSITLPQNVIFTDSYADVFEYRRTPVTGISLDKTEMTVYIGNSEKLTATVEPGTATNKKVTWSSSDNNIATVDSNGNVTGVGAGAATITVTTVDGGKTATCTVTVPAHTHNWTYTAEGVTITATCGNADGGCPNTDGGSVTLQAPTELVYTGTEKSAAVEGTITGSDTVEISYSGDRKSVGDHTASITVGGVTADVTFTITPATPVLSWNDQTVVYTGSPADLPAIEVTLVNGEIFRGTVTCTYDDGKAGLPTDVGTYTVTASIAAAGNYTAASKTIQLTIIRAASSIAFNGYNPGKLYDGQPLENPTEGQLVITGADYSDVTFAWYKDAVAEENKLASAPSDAGTYYVVASIAETGNATASCVTSGVITIGKQNLPGEKAALGASQTYNGTEQKPAVTIDGLTEGVDFTVKYPDDMTNAGEKIITVTGTGNYSGTVTLKWSIQKAVAGIEQAPQPRVLTYEAMLQKLVTEGITNDGALVYSQTEDGAYTETIPTGKDVGVYQVWYYVMGDANHIDSEKAYVEVAIGKAKLTVTASDKTIVYGDEPANDGVVCAGFVGGESTADLDGQLAFTYSYEQFGKVGSYTITPSGLTSSRYDITFVSGKLTVTAKQITVKADAKAKVYGEADPELTYTVEGLVNNDPITGSLSRPQGEDVGLYAIGRGTLTAGENYAITYTGAALTVSAKTVTEADVALKGSLVYTGEELTQNVTVTEGVTYEVTGNKGVNAGTYELTVTGIGNYTGDVKLTWTVAKAEATVSKAPAAGRLTYTGETQALVTAGTTDDGTLLYSLTEDGTYTETVPTGKNAGKYTVWHYVKGDANHSDSAKTSVMVTVKKAKATITVDTAPIHVTYGETVVLPAATADFGTVTCDKTAADLVEIGTYRVTYSVEGTENYVGDTKTVTVTVGAKPIGSATVTLSADLIYNGETQEPAIAVKDGNVTLTVGTDYTVSYEKVRENASPVPVTGAPRDAGSYNAVITGKGIYGGEVRKAFAIKPNTSITVVPETLADATYTGEAIVPAVTVQGVKSAVLVKDQDYTVICENNTNAGTAKVTVTGIGNYAGAKKELTFTIRAKELKDENVTLAERILAYKEGKNVPVITVKDGSRNLTEGTDYILSYYEKENGNLEAPNAVGTYLVQIIGRGNYSGVVNKTFIITDDDKAPEITGVTNGKTYYTTQKVTAKDANLVYVTRNAVAVTPVVPAGTEVALAGNTNVTYTVTAADIAEHTTTVTVTMKPIHTLDDTIETLTVENVKLTDKTNVQAVVAAVSAIRNGECANATQEEKAALDVILRHANALLKVITDVEDTIAKISAMPDARKTEPDHENAVKTYESAKKAYDALTAHGKELVGTENKAKLDAMYKALTDYDVIEGNRSSYTKGSGKTFSITANGYYGKFTGLKVDGKLLDSKHYTVKSGSTIVTFHNTYLNTLSNGKHTIEFLYTDGSTGTDHYFRIASSNGSPSTGDSNPIVTSSVIMATSLLGLIVLLTNRKKFFFE